MNLKGRVYLIVVSLGGLFFAFVGIPRLDIGTHLLALFLLVAASFFSEIYELEILPSWFFSTHVAIATAAVFIGGMPLAIWVVILSTIPAEILLRWDHLKRGIGRFIAPVVFNTAQLALSAAAAAAVYDAIVRVIPTDFLPYHAMIVSFLAYVVTNIVLVAGIISVSSEDSFIRIVRSRMKNYHLEYGTMCAIAILMATMHEVSPEQLALSFVPLALVDYSMRNYLRLRRNSYSAFKKITDLLAERDQYTGEHSDEVEDLAVKLAEALKLSDDKIEAVRAGAAIHDIGKIAIPDAILNKPGPLTPEECATMRRHTIIGEEIIRDIAFYRNVAPIVRHEHEHWDGSGYPDGLVGTDIPIGARVVAVADVYSALTTARGYRPPQGKPLKYTHEEACSILSAMAGTVLDPNLVEVFLKEIADSLLVVRQSEIAQ